MKVSGVFSSECDRLIQIREGSCGGRGWFWDKAFGTRLGGDVQDPCDAPGGRLERRTHGIDIARVASESKS